MLSDSCASHFLSYFEQGSVIRLLASQCEEYSSLFLDNICHTVMVRAISCVLQHKPVHTLELAREDAGEIYKLFQGKAAADIERSITAIILRLTERIDGCGDYFTAVAAEYRFLVMEERLSISYLHVP